MSFNRKGSINLKAQSSLEEVQSHLDKATEALAQGTRLLEEREKLILLADKSEFGWKTVEEYTQHELAELFGYLPINPYSQFSPWCKKLRSFHFLDSVGKSIVNVSASRRLFSQTWQLLCLRQVWALEVGVSTTWLNSKW